MELAVFRQLFFTAEFVSVLFAIIVALLISDRVTKRMLRGDSVYRVIVVSVALLAMGTAFLYVLSVRLKGPDFGIESVKVKRYGAMMVVALSLVLSYWVNVEWRTDRHRRVLAFLPVILIVMWSTILSKETDILDIVFTIAGFGVGTIAADLALFRSSTMSANEP